ncbi:MAG: cell division ATP-binding protein FtsE [Saccharofermentans sp.]|nr:cell division ATP-binding protein FtsE [Saccharofermentans sp.]
MIHYYNVKKTYKSGVEALKGVSFEIETGEFVFVIGKSGSGKSTLLKCMTKEEDPTEGKVTIDNFDITHMSRALIPVLRRNIGMIYQDFRLIETKTVEENIAFVGEVVGIPKKSLNQAVKIVLNVVGLKDKANTYPQELSGGEQQRVAIARAMVNNPKLIVADEPTGNLDPETSESIMALLLEINRSGTTVIVCTHDSNMVDRMKQRVIEVEDGRIVRDEYRSSYTSEEDTVRPSPIDDRQLAAAGMQEPVTISFGDDPAFEDDRDYGDDYDDEQYIRQAARKPIVHEDDSFVFGESKVEEAPAEVSVPELKAVPEEAETEVPAETKPDKKALKAERKAEKKAAKAAKADKNDKKSNVRAPQVRFPDLDILEDDDE